VNRHLEQGAGGPAYDGLGLCAEIYHGKISVHQIGKANGPAAVVGKRHACEAGFVEPDHEAQQPAILEHFNRGAISLTRLLAVSD
jgi:hypothetical protein